MSGTARSKYPLHLLASLKEAAARLARNDGVSLNQWITAAVAQKIGAVETADEFLVRRPPSAAKTHPGCVESPSPEEPDARMGRIRICGSRWRVTARGYLANRGGILVYTRSSRHVHRQSHPFERLFPSFSAGIGTEISLYPIESFVYHHAR